MVELRVSRELRRSGARDDVGDALVGGVRSE